MNANSALLPVSDSAVTASFESSVSLTPNLFFHLDDPALSFLSSLPSSLVCDKSFRVLPTSFLSFKKVIFIRLTSTINNLIVTVTRFDGSTLFVRSVGYEKFFNSQKRSFTSC